MMWRCLRSFVLGLGVLAAFCGCASIRSADSSQFGVEYRLIELADPVPNRVHVLRVNLSDKRIKPSVIVADDPDGDGPATAALTDPFKLASDKSIIAFVNTNPWGSVPDQGLEKGPAMSDGHPVRIQGLAVSGGQVRNPALKPNASVWFDNGGRVFMGQCPDGVEIADGAGGFQMILRDGVVIPRPGGTLHPRTAIGVDLSGRTMWLVVVDGRHPGFSEGMTLHELSLTMRELGCWSAINMDGGGSSIMALAGEDGLLRLMNSPSDRHMSFIPRIRPIPVILAIKRNCSRGHEPVDESGDDVSRVATTSLTRE